MQGDNKVDHLKGIGVGRMIILERVLREEG
jgi:hypothetical protein